MVLDYMYTSFLLDKITLQIRHGTDVFSDTLQTDTVQTLFSTPCRLTRCRRNFSDTLQTDTVQTLFLTPSRLTLYSHYF